MNKIFTHCIIICFSFISKFLTLKTSKTVLSAKNFLFYWENSKFKFLILITIVLSNYLKKTNFGNFEFLMRTHNENNSYPFFIC